MPQPIRNWYFEPEPFPPEAASSGDDDGIAPRLASRTAPSLQRHGARLLNPGDAARIHGSGPGGGARPQSSTVHRATTLLIPGDLLRDDAVVGAINAALAPVGMSIAAPDPDSRQVRSNEAVAEALRRLPRVAGLLPAAPPPGKSAVPVVLDAWTALQTLRAAADAAVRADRDDTAKGAEAERAEAAGTGLTPEIVRRIGLEHLLESPFARISAISGAPFTEGNPLTAPSGSGSYAYSGGSTRAPVMVCLPAPRRRELAALGCRRPVVAVLDTGVRAHPWLDVRPDPAGRYIVDPADGFVIDDPGIQAGIHCDARYAAEQQEDHSRELIADAWDGPAAGHSLVGELDDATGHGTFIAGIVRQAAPDARVLAIRIMHSDGVVYEGDLICALALLADRIAAAEQGSMAEMVDVISLSLGYFDESAADVTYSSGLWQVIQVLLDLGVSIVAAAGNYSTSRRFYPAAFSLQSSPVPVISVGALNPNGSKALFSDGGRWVRAWAAGAAVVSTYPDDVNGSLTPPVRVHAHPGRRSPADGRPGHREALDPDDFRGGFATWSGTSFAAPLIAAHIAARLLDQSAMHSMDEPGNQAAADRTLAALASLGWPGGS